MVARGEFRDDAAMLTVQFDLGIDFVGEDAFVAAVEGDGGFVAGRFDGKDEGRVSVMGFVGIAGKEKARAGCGAIQSKRRSGKKQQAFANLVGEFVGAMQDVGKHRILRGLDEDNQRFVVGMDGADVNLAFFTVDGDGAGRTQL